MMALLPVLPIRDMVLFPGVIAPLFVERPQSLKALEEASLHDKQILVVSQKEMQVDVPEGDDLYTVGTLCQIIQMVRIPDGTTKVLVEG
ncbi:MAG: LON peptidase substrate-binding domain-containing protein, partial [Synergistaceae bacterium]|nr:LON peptidase substrate-binding domain-containing protein [Synergistaceae bacterium]